MSQKQKTVTFSRPGQRTHRAIGPGNSSVVVKMDSGSNRYGTKVLLLLLFIVASLLWRQLDVKRYKSLISIERDAHSSQVRQLENRIASIIALPKPRLRSDSEYARLAETTNIPNTKTNLEPEYITGNIAADKNIRELASTKGYSIKPLVLSGIVYVDGFPLQVDAAKGWLDLKLSAAEEGISLGLKSTYRSPEEQRVLFMSSLGLGPSTYGLIAAGAYNTKVIEVIGKIAPPSYSRHQTGVVIDIIDANEPSKRFEDTRAFGWLSTEHYKNPVNSGWIPTNPNNLDEQGPELEPWEFMFVGIKNLN